MANIVRNFNDTQLDLISDGTSTSYVFNELYGDYVKITVQTGNRFVDSFTSNGTPGFPVYTDGITGVPGLYIKTNEVLDENSVAEGSYNLRFDFLRNIFSNFSVYTEGGCNSPVDGESTLTTEEDCISLGSCNYVQGPRATVEFVSFEECCGVDGTDCTDTDDGLFNVWTGYTFTEPVVEHIPEYKNAKFYIKEISPSRKEIRLITRDSSNNLVDMDDTTFRSYFQDKNYGLMGGMGTLNNGDSYGDYTFDYLITLNESVHIPIVNWTWDEESLDETTIVIRMNEPLPSQILVLTEVGVEKKILETHEQLIYYVSNVKTTSIGGALIPDVDEYSDEGFITEDNYQNYNQLLATASINNTDIDFIQLENNNDYKNLNVDFSNFSNHVIFGSAKSKVSNFKDKVVKIENYLTQISQSLHQTGSHVESRRKSLFSKIQTTKMTFTPYEKFLYYGNDSGSYSAPNIGSNLAHQVPVNMLHATELNNYDGFNLVHKFENEPNGGRTHIFTKKYFSQDPPFYNYSGSVFLSFLMKADEVANNNDSAPFSWQNTNTSNDKLIVPFGNFHGEIILQPTLTGSEWRRFIFESSQSYWRPTGSAMVDGEGDVTKVYDNFNNPLYWEVLNTTEKVFSASISGSTGTGYPILLDDIYNEFGTYLTSSGNPFTGSLLPAGEYFNLHLDNNETAAITSSFITDVKISLKNPNNVLPFGEVYSTGSTDWENWYNGLYSSASTYDENNIHSLKNNLPLKIVEDNEYKNLHTFVDMWGEQFDLIRNHIDNYSNFYKRGYSEGNSVPENLLPILADNLGWELINPFSGSLSNYYNQFSGSSDSNKKVTDDLWKRNLNNLIYIYKTKGTVRSLHALLNCLGYPSDLLNVNEFGGMNYQTNQLLSTESDVADFNNFDVTSLSGNHSDVTKVIPFNYLNLEGNNLIPLNWGSTAGVGGEGPDDTIEFMFLSKPTTNTQELISSHFGGSSLTSSFWDIRLLAGSTSKLGSIQLRMNTSTTPSAAGITHIVQTKELPIKDGANFVNVMVQKRDLTSPTGEYSASLDITVAKKSPDGNSFSIFETTSSTVNNVTQLDNWSSSNASRTTGNLLIGRDFTGSFAEVRAWSGSLSQSVFRQHVLNPKSVVGNNLNDSQNNFYYRFRFDEQISSGSTTLTLNDSNPYGLISNPTNFTKTVEVSESFGQMSQKKSININYVGLKNNPFVQKNTRMISVNSDRKMIMNLSPGKTTTLSSQQVNKEITSKNIELFNSPIDKVNDYLVDNLSGKNVVNKYSKWSDKFESTYSDLDSLRDLLMRGVFVDVNKYIKVHAESGIYNPLLTNSVKKIIPERVKYNSGIKIKPTLLERTKYKHKKMSVNEDKIHKGIMKNPMYSDWSEYLFDLSTSKKQNIYSGKFLDIHNDKGITLSKSLNQVINEGVVDNHISSASFRKSKNLNFYKVDYNVDEYYSTSGLKLNIFGTGSSEQILPKDGFTLSSNYHNVYITAISHSIIQSQSAIVNENFYDYTLSLDDRIIQTGKNVIEHKFNMDMVNLPQFGQSGKYINNYNDVIKVMDKDNYSASAFYNNNYHESVYQYLENHYSSSAIINPNSFEDTLDMSSELYSASGQYYDTENTFASTIDVGNSFYNHSNGVFRNGIIYKNGKTNLEDMWGTGINDLHFYDPLNHLPGGKSHKFSNLFNNIHRYTSQRVYELIGDLEVISSSVNQYGVDNIDYTDKKFFLNRKIRNTLNADKEYNYKSLLNDSTSTQAGRPVGRTRFVRDNNGTLEYPSNHVIHSPGLREYQLRFIFNHETPSQWYLLNSNKSPITASKVPSFKLPNNKNAQYDVIPKEQAYSVNVGGSNTSKTITITKK